MKDGNDRRFIWDFLFNFVLTKKTAIVLGLWLCGLLLYLIGFAVVVVVFIAVSVKVLEFLDVLMVGLSFMGLL